MGNFKLTNIDGEYYADSRDVAEAIERPHCDLLRTIRTYCDYLGKSKIAFTDFFVEAEYTTAQNKTLPCFLITKKGCDMIANKLTGERGTLFTAAYVTAFENMKAQIEAHLTTIQHFPPKATSAGEVASLVKNVRITMERQNSPAVKVAKQTELILRHFGIPVIRDFVETSPYEQLTFDDEAV